MHRASLGQMYIYIYIYIIHIYIYIHIFRERIIFYIYMYIYIYMYLTVDVKLVTCEVFQLPMYLLKACASANIPSIVVTCSFRKEGHPSARGDQPRGELIGLGMG